MDLHLADKIAVVTGANKGIGLAVTRALVDEGAYVVAGSRSTDNLDRLDRLTAVPVDLTPPDGPASLVACAIDEPRRAPRLRIDIGAVGVRRAAGTDDRYLPQIADYNLAALGRGIDPGGQRHRAPSKCSVASWCSRTKP